MSTALSLIPQEDHHEYGGLPLAVKRECLVWMETMIRLAGVAGRGLGAAIKLEAHRLQVSTATVTRKWYAFKESHDWRVLINRSKAGMDYWDCDREKLPVAFIDFWKGLCGDNQRKCKPQYRKLLRQLELWRMGRVDLAIPGYAEPPANAPGFEHPFGWGERNLYRYVPSPFELKARRQGRVAASELRPQVFTTRMGLEVGQYYMFDDLWHDFKVNFIGQRHAQRLLQFHAHDVFSACNFARGMKPVVENEMTGAEEHLKEHEMFYLVVHALTHFGYRKSGTVLITEHATARIKESLERMLFDLTGGLVTVERGGIEKRAAFAGMYPGRGKGNFRFKASLESSGNLIHNETADILLIPGQVGSNGRLNAPEELHGREKHNDALLSAIAARPELAGILRLPFLEVNQAMQLVNRIHELINSRTEHDLEGWIEAGLTAAEVRVDRSMPWMGAERLQLLAPMQREAMEAIVTSNPDLMRSRRLSPTEVFNRGVGSLIKLPESTAAILLGDLEKMELPAVNSSLIEFERQELSPSVLRYEARVNGQLLPEGVKYDGIVNPMDLTKLMLFNGKGGYIGTCEAWGKVCRDDTDALHRMMGKAAKIESELLAPVAAQGAKVTKQRLEDAKWNAEHLGTTKEEVQKKADASALARAALLQEEDVTHD